MTYEDLVIEELADGEATWKARAQDLDGYPQVFYLALDELHRLTILVDRQSATIRRVMTENRQLRDALASQKDQAA